MHPVAPFCFAGAAALVGYTILAARKARRSRSWPSVPGRITTSLIQETSGRSPGYYAIIRYEYEVGGTTYKGDQIAFGMQASVQDRRKVEDEVRPFPVGATVPIHHDPKRPREAVLRVGEASSVAMPLMFAGILTFLGLLLCT